MKKPTVNVNVEELSTQICPKCESPYCTEVFILKHLPALMSPDGKAQLIKVPAGFGCVNCKSSMFKPEVIDNKEYQAKPDDKSDDKSDDKPFLDLVN